MRSILLLLAAVALAACAESEERPPAMPTLSLADVAGTWTVHSMAEGSDSVLVTSELNATATTTGWTLVLPGRDPIPQHIVLAGDSVVMHAGPFESVLRPGVMVTTESSFRLVGGALEGWTVARYATQAPDSVVRLRSRGMRAQ